MMAHAPLQPCLPGEYFTPEARSLCARVKHKSELSDEEVLLLAITAAQAALARYWHPGERSAEEALDTIGSILDHEDVVAALFRRIEAIEAAPTDRTRGRIESKS